LPFDRHVSPACHKRLNFINWESATFQRNTSGTFSKALHWKGSTRSGYSVPIQRVSISCDGLRTKTFSVPFSQPLCSRVFHNLPFPAFCSPNVRPILNLLDCTFNLGSPHFRCQGVLRVQQKEHQPLPRSGA